MAEEILPPLPMPKTVRIRHVLEESIRRAFRDTLAEYKGDNMADFEDEVILRLFGDGVSDYSHVAPAVDFISLVNDAQLAGLLRKQFLEFPDGRAIIKMAAHDEATGQINMEIGFERPETEPATQQ